MCCASLEHIQLAGQMYNVQGYLFEGVHISYCPHGLNANHHAFNYTTMETARAKDVTLYVTEAPL